jgi:hypothetical protein
MYRRFPGSIPPLTAAVLAAALLGCDGAGTSPPPRTQETSVATPPAVTPPAPPPLAQVPVMRTNTCDKDTFVGPPHFADIPTVAIPASKGFDGAFDKDDIEAVVAKMASQPAPSEVSAALRAKADAKLVTARGLDARDQAYLSELAARAGELDGLDPEAREQRKAEIKARHLGD